MKGPLVLLAAVVVGIVLGDAGGADPATGFLVGGAALLVMALGLAGTRRALVVAAVGLVLLGCALEQRGLHGLDVSPLVGPTRTGADGEAVVTLAEDPSAGAFSTEAIARVAAFRGRDAGGRRVLLSAGGDARSELLVLAAGDRVRLTGRLRPLDGFVARLRWRHVVARLDVDEVRAVAGPSAPWMQLANAARDVVIRGTVGLPATPRALMIGFLLGDTRDLPPDLVVAFRDAGLSHLLAVSGANVAFVVALVGPVLRRLPRRGRLGAGLAVIVLFGTMTRWEPSVLRAATMASLVLVARYLGRPADARRVLVLAVVALLLVDPFLARSVGFLLSCGACAGIVSLGGRLSARVPGPWVLRETLGVTAAAQVGVAPILLVVFGTIPLVSLPANLLAVPLAAPLTMWGLTASVLADALGPTVGVWVQLPSLALLRAVEAVARVAASMPLAIGPTGAAVISGAVVVLGVVHRRVVAGRR